MSDDKDNVVKFTLSQGLKVRKDNRTVFCSHRSILVYEHERTLICEECGKYFDAFDYVLKMTNERGSLIRDYTVLTREVKQRRGEVAELKKEQISLKGKVARLNKKLVGDQ